MTIDIRARLRSEHSEGSMSSSNIEGTNEQARGRETELVAHDRVRKHKSPNAFTNMEARLAKVELAMVNTWKEVELIEQSMKKGLEDLRE